jgi:hypothetical protein
LDVDDGCDDVLGGFLLPGFIGTLDEKGRRYFRVVSARWRLKSVAFNLKGVR